MGLEFKENKNSVYVVATSDFLTQDDIGQIEEAFQKSENNCLIIDLTKLQLIDNEIIIFLNEQSKALQKNNGLVIAVIKNSLAPDFQDKMPEVVILGTEHEAEEAIMMHELENQFKAELGDI